LNLMFDPEKNKMVVMPLDDDEPPRKERKTA